MAALNCVMLSPSGQPVPLPGEKFLFSSTPTVSLSLFSRPPGADFSIQPKKGEEYKAVGGTVHVSPRRIVYVAKDARPSVGPPSGDTASSSVGATASAGNAGVGSLASGSASNTSARTAGASSSQVTLATLSVPLRHFVDSHLVQPWLRATYLEALCLCSEDAEDLRVRLPSFPRDGVAWLHVSSPPTLQSPHIARFYFKEGGGFEFYQAIEEVKARAEIGGRSGVAEEQLRTLDRGTRFPHCMPD